MKQFQWFYETWNGMEWSAEPVSRLAGMVWRDKYLYRQVGEIKL